MVARVGLERVALHEIREAHRLAIFMVGIWVHRLLVDLLMMECIGQNY